MLSLYYKDVLAVSSHTAYVTVQDRLEQGIAVEMYLEVLHSVYNLKGYHCHEA